MYRSQRGIALIVVYLVIVILVIWGLAFLARSISEKKIAEIEKDSAKALYIAEGGIERVRQELYSAFKTYFEANGQDIALFAWFDDVDTDLAKLPADVRSAGLGEGIYNVNISGIIIDVSVGRADVTLASVGTINDASRTIIAVVKFSLAQSPVFNYSYFVNNFGWFYGGGISSNGDARSNGDFSFQGTPKINGDIYAAVNPDLEAEGVIDGTYKNDSLSYYEDNAPTEARPMNPTDPANPEGTVYEAGYDGNSECFEEQEPLDMPYLGDLSIYKSMAASEGGTISQGGVTLVNAVYEGNGPDGNPGTADDGCVVLLGTVDNPIEINGPVVINKDVVIKGVVTGQGTIYAGRNTHIIGDITYADGPIWPKPDSDPAATDQTNNTKDFLGLAAKGNVVIGDYTRTDWTKNVTPYLEPPFTKTYVVDATDVDIGYVTGHDGEGNPIFNGDYTAYDGGAKDSGAGGSQDRRYYESSLSDIYIQSIAESSSSIRNIEAITYTNHAYAGKVGSFTLNGSLISRDEAIIYTGSINMNYDVRAWEGLGSLDIFLPRSLALSEIISWKE